MNSVNVKYNGTNLHVRFSKSDFENRPNLIALHGFMGNSRDWKFLAEKNEVNFYSLDLIGHGNSDSPEKLKYYSPQSITEQIETIIESLKISEPILLGYSMGGRAAITFAAISKMKLRGLILESSTIGIYENSDREKRLKSDKILSEEILNTSVENFVRNWLNKPLFNSLLKLNKIEYLHLLNERFKNNKTGLVNSLLGFGTGSMPYWGNEFSRLELPILLLTGELDTKFTQINGKMQKLNDKAVHKIAEYAGHNIHLEKPEDFTNFVFEFIETNFN